MRTPVLLLAALLGLGRGVLPQTPGISGIQLQGVVRDAETGRPLSKVGIRIAGLTTTTDAEGRFTVPGLSAGRQLITASRVGYILDGLSDPKTIQRAVYRDNGVYVKVDSETQLQISLYMWPSPSVTGTVFDSFGQPVLDAMVRALRFAYNSEGTLALASVAPLGQTDDRGEFETESLAPGEYVFLAEKSRPETDPRDQFIGTFYPAYSDAKPDPVTVRPGVTTRLPRIVLASAPAVRVQIRPLDETGIDPPGYVSMILRRKGDSVPWNTFLLSNPRAIRLPEGSYEVEVAATIRKTGSLSLDLESAAVSRATFEVRDKDIDLPVKIVLGTRVEGRVIKREKSGKLTPVGGALVRFSGSFFLSSLRSFAASSSSDGAFAFSSLPEGTYQVYVPHYGEESGWLSEQDLLEAPRDACFSELRQNDAALPGDQLQIAGHSGSVTVILRESTTHIQGKAVDSNGQAASSAIVVLVPDDRHRNGSYAVMTADQNGDFEFACTPAGNYRVFAWTELPGAAYRNEEFMARYKDRGTEVRVADGDKLTIRTELIER